VLAGVRELGPGALDLAQALAVLGDGCELRHAGTVAGLEMPEAIALAAGPSGSVCWPPVMHRVSCTRWSALRCMGRWRQTSATPRTERRRAYCTPMRPRRG
jgi:hypothetical protein